MSINIPMSSQMLRLLEYERKTIRINIKLNMASMCPMRLSDQNVGRTAKMIAA